MEVRGMQQGSGERVLVVDDEAHFRFSVSLMLKKAGYEPATAASADEASRLVREAMGRGDGFDLFLVDIQMPGRSGIELIRELATGGVHPPIIVVSGLFDAETVKELWTTDCADLLAKPFEPGDLIEKISALLRRDRPDGQKEHKGGGVMRAG